MINVHEALQRATLKDEPKVLVTRSIKANAVTWQCASDICKSNGTDISKWLRECINGLIEDYSGKSLE